LDGVGDELADVPRVGAFLAAGARERAELALHPAHVRVVQVEVVDEVDLVAAAAQAAGGVGELAQRKQVFRLEQRDSVVEVEPLAGEYLLAHRRERVEIGGEGHRRAESTAGSGRPGATRAAAGPSRGGSRGRPGSARSSR